MSTNRQDYGLLINQDIKLWRWEFKQMTSLIGINCQYYAPNIGKEFDSHGDLLTRYKEPITVGCIFNDHPDQRSTRKMGQISELQENSSLIHVPYDLEGLQIGALFLVPSGIDGAPGRMFRVIKMSNIMIYPASITCEIAPEYETTTTQSEITNFVDNNFTLLNDNEEDD